MRAGAAAAGGHWGCRSGGGRGGGGKGAGGAGCVGVGVEASEEAAAKGNLGGRGGRGAAAVMD